MATLGPAGRKSNAVREVSGVSLSEIAVKQTRGKLVFSKTDAMAGIADLRLRISPFTAEHAFRLFDLPTHHPIRLTVKSSRRRSWKISRS